MMEKLSIEKMIRITQGCLLRQGGNGRAVRGISTDTRRISKGDLFIALTGEKMDGHDYIAEAVEKGAAAVCVSDETKLAPGDYTAVLVNDTLDAYQAIAAKTRMDRGYTVVGVTGSVGKTSTRTMIAAALSRERRVYQTQANYNNDVGLPKTLLETPEDADVCIVEMAMRGLGEIRRLTRVARPDIAVITNIGFSHIERLGSQDQIFKAKIEIVEGLAPDGLLILNANDPYLLDYAMEIGPSVRTAAVMIGGEIEIPSADFTVRGYDLKQTASEVTFQVEIKSFEGIPVLLRDVVVPVPGTHNVTNALVGIAAAVELNLNLKNAVLGLTGYRAVGNRQRILECGGMTLIDDSYNAGPESMCAAIAMLSDIAGKRRKIAALGGMLELGNYAAKAHENVGGALVRAGIDRAFVCGPYASCVQKGIEAQSAGDASVRTQASLFETRDALTCALLEEVRKDDVILIKGSRMFEMEKVAQALAEKTAQNKE